MYSYCEQNFNPSLKSGIYEIDLKYKSKKMSFGNFKKLSGESGNKGSNFEIWDENEIKQEVEKYWKEMSARSENRSDWEEKSFFYAPGISGSFFPDNVSGFNPNKIDLKYSVIHKVDKEEYIDGIQTPMLYFGQKYSTFGMHAEDRYLSGMSYNLYGAPKVWYVVSRDNKDDIIDLANNSIEKNIDCSYLLQHKITTVSPEAMDLANINYSVV